MVEYLADRDIPRALNATSSQKINQFSARAWGSRRRVRKGIPHNSADWCEGEAPAGVTIADHDKHFSFTIV
jgi:hypothetical protein